MTYLEQLEAATKPIVEAALAEIREVAGNKETTFPCGHIWADNDNYLVGYIPRRHVFTVLHFEDSDDDYPEGWDKEYGPDQLLPEAICQAADIIKTLI